MKKIVYVLMIVLLVFLLVYLYQEFKPVKHVNYKGQTLYFRDDIKEASKVEVYPNEQTVYNLFWDNSIENINIIFKPLEKGSGYYMLESFELTYKLTTIYALNGMKKEFDALYVESYGNITSSDNVLKIVLVHPQLTNKTLVEAKDNIIFIHAKDYRDFDLATIKTILIAMRN
jgi:hypothetical protein